MDSAEAIKVLVEFLEILGRHRAMQDAAARSGQSLYDDPACQELEEQIAVRLHIVESIVTEVDSRYAERFRTPNKGAYKWAHENQFDVAQEAAGALGWAAKEEAIMGFSGPRLAAASLHPWIWEPAARLWDNGHRREAIQAAATALFDQWTPTKLGREHDTKGGKDLMGQAFTTKDPEPGAPRLRIPNYVKGSADWTSVHEGAMHLGQGAAQAIRNVSTHSTDEPDEDKALEMLATLSLVARMVDEAIVET